MEEIHLRRSGWSSLEIGCTVNERKKKKQQDEQAGGSELKEETHIYRLTSTSFGELLPKFVKRERNIKEWGLTNQEEHIRF